MPLMHMVQSKSNQEEVMVGSLAPMTNARLKVSFETELEPVPLGLELKLKPEL
jgi:hypothetical protein